ncbi:MAG: hypothetical protein WBV74_15305 [Pseudonocardiaceae bacterium]
MVTCTEHGSCNCCRPSSNLDCGGSPRSESGQASTWWPTAAHWRIHALHDGALVRTQETLAFQHAADGAATLLAAAAAYQRLEQLIRRRETGEPLEQIVGWVN